MNITFLSPENPEIHYSRGMRKTDNCPQQMSASSFDEFAAQVLADRSLAKGDTYICGPLSVGPHVKAPEKYLGEGTWRITERALPRRFLPFDVDGVDSPETFERLLEHMQGSYRGFAYTTASHTGEKPRCRMVLAQSRPTSREEGIKLGMAVERAISDVIGPGKIQFDQCVYRAETPLYTPLLGAETWRFNGCYVDVDAALDSWRDMQSHQEVASGAKNDLAIEDAEFLATLHAKPICDRESVVNILNLLSIDAVDSYPSWIKVGMALHHQFDGGVEGLEIWNEWSQKSDKYEERACQEKWRSFVTNRGEQVVTFGSVMKMAKESKPDEYAALFSGSQQVNDVKYGLELMRLSDIEPENINWIWPGWLAEGKLHILAGQPGTGKTTLALSLAATISRGGRFPDGTTCEAGNVLIWSGEDDPADTLVPRLIAMGVDKDRVFFVGDVHLCSTTKVTFDPAMHMEALEHEAKRLGNVKMIICDPIVSSVAGDSHKNTEVRRALQPLVDLGKKLNCAIFGISHFTKGTAGREPLERVTGSLAFGAVARLVFGAAKLPDEEGGGSIFCRMKSNIGEDGDGYKYQLWQVNLDDPHDGITASAVMWGEKVTGSASVLLGTHDGRNSAGGALEEAMDFLRDHLMFGELPANDIKNAADAAGISAGTLSRARTELKIQARKSRGQGGPWVWSLPLSKMKDDQFLPEKNDEHLGHLGNESAKDGNINGHSSGITPDGQYDFG